MEDPLAAKKQVESLEPGSFFISSLSGIKTLVSTRGKPPEERSFLD